MAGIYLHIPFCKQACYYCDFHFSTNTSRLPEMGEAIRKELILQSTYLGKQVETIYFGGGTPSLLGPRLIGQMLETIYQRFQVIENPEITLEANPDDLSNQYLVDLYSVGVNRLSIGIQSFDDNVLRFLNRSHNAQGAIQSVDSARKAGFQNISLDLIYAIPGQLQHQWIDNIKTAITLNPEHLSAYSLTIEEKTVFGKWLKQGKFTAANEDVSAEQFETLLQLLEDAGYEHYEISNFARPGCYSRHNSNYWKQIEYLGVGPSAHSYNLHSRQFNVSNNHRYLDELQKGAIPFTLEMLSHEDKVNDYLLTTLRTRWGSNLRKLKEDLNFDLLESQGEYIEGLVKNGLANIDQDHLILTRKGKFLADKISSDMFVTAQT